MNTIIDNAVSATLSAAAPAVATTPTASSPGNPIPGNKVAISFLNRDTDPQLVTNASKIIAMMTGNLNFPAPFPTLAQIATTQTAFAAAVTALDRSKASTVRRNQTRAALVQNLRDLALYVQHASAGDPEELLSSGFPMQRKAGTIAPTILPPKNLRARQAAVSGCLIVRCKSDTTAKSYQWRIATAQAPTVWTVVDPTTVANCAFNNLVPGTQYLIQVRAFARKGPSNWSDSVAMFAN